MLVDALAAKVLKRVKVIPSGAKQQVPANVKTAAPETQRVMFFKNQEKMMLVKEAGEADSKPQK